MNKYIMLAIALGIAIFTAGCSVFEGRPEQNNVNQARGSWVWMNERLDEEQEGAAFNDRFGNESSSDLNDAEPDAVSLNPTFPDMINN